MTDYNEGLEKIERLRKIIAWAQDNRVIWDTFVCGGEEGMSLSDVCYILDQAKHHGFMELYLITTVRCVFSTDIPIMDEEYMQKLVTQFDNESSRT